MTVAEMLVIARLDFGRAERAHVFNASSIKRVFDMAPVDVQGWEPIALWGGLIVPLSSSTLAQTSF